MRSYSGRIAVYEILTITPKIRDLIYAKASRSEIEQELKTKEADFVSLKDNALKLVSEGVTTSFEALRIINEVDFAD